MCTEFSPPAVATEGRQGYGHVDDGVHPTAAAQQQILDNVWNTLQPFVLERSQQVSLYLTACVWPPAYATIKRHT